MKIRNGFVSNSSSSSFLIIGKRLDIDQISIEDTIKKEIVVIGKELYNGLDLIRLTPEILKRIKEMRSSKRESEKFWYVDDVFEVYHAISDYDGEGFTLSKEELIAKSPEKFELFTFEKDNWGTSDDLETFISNYYD